MKQLLKFLCSRMFIVVVLVLIQMYVLGVAVIKITDYFVYVYVGFTVISLGAVMYILGRRDNPSYKLAWIIPILIFPVFGGLFYILFGANKLNKKFKKRVKEVYDETCHLCPSNEELVEEIEEKDKSAANQIKYIQQYSTYPIYKDTTTEYLKIGEIYFEKLKAELRKAEHFIFMEYFIIEEGKMWGEVLDILVEKVKQGIDVRVMYDDAGTIQTLPYKYDERLRQLGIKTVVFNQVKPLLNMKVNNRDHRKIAVIDGHTGFTGGINLADEYINHIEKHGHWKDTGIMLKGEAVWNLTAMFLQVWHFVTNDEIIYDQYRPHVHHPESFEGDGYVLPFGDSPYDEEIVGENVYLNIINKAKEYVYITSPYLIVDNEIITALSLAAKSGVDVRIITPHKEDKWYVHILTTSYYQQLIESGVKIYEYTPGFIHAKMFLADDEIAVVGTINLDYRSLYLHFECATWLYHNSAIWDIKEDMLETLAVSQQVSSEDTQGVKWYHKGVRAILRVFAPLM